MSFKAGDFVVATKNSPYDVTNKYIFENYNYDIDGVLYNLPFFILTNYYCSLSDLAVDIGVLYSEHPEYNVKELLHYASVKLKWASIYKKS